ncbi:MAG: glycosyl hydrolase 53 family protein, partial [Oscillospiraceae bacterium]|nr:glycosyl hydrolase 53 family protein [Oscillospiraceae bacterium]
MKRFLALLLAVILIAALVPPTAILAIQGPVPEGAPMVDGVPQIWDVAESNIADRWWVETMASSYQADYVPGNALSRYFAYRSDGDGNIVPMTFAAFPDEDPTKPWLAEVGDLNPWLQVYLGGEYDAVRKVVIEFPSATTVYQYVLEGSTDGATWTTLADRSDNDRAAEGFTDLFHFPGLRYLRVRFVSLANVGISDLRIYNYLREDMDNGSDTTLGPGAMGHWWNAGASGPGMINAPEEAAPSSIREGVHPARVAPAGVDPADHEAAIVASAESGNNLYGMMYDLGWTTTRVRVWHTPMADQAPWLAPGGTGNGDSWSANRDQDIAQHSNTGNPVFPVLQDPNGTSTRSNLYHHARFITGAGQRLSVNLHYADSWADPQNQPKPYDWADLPFCLCDNVNCPFADEKPELNVAGEVRIPNFRRPTTPVTNAGQATGNNFDLAQELAAPGFAHPHLFDPNRADHWRYVDYGLVQAVYDFTYEVVETLILQGTAPHIVAVGNEISNGMLWGSEYEYTNPFTDYHDFFHRFIAGREIAGGRIDFPNSPSVAGVVPDWQGRAPGDAGFVADARGPAPRGGGVEWVTYRAAIAAREAGNMAEYEQLMGQFDESVLHLSALIAAGQRAVDDLNQRFATQLADAGIGQMETEIHFAFNVFEQPPGSPRILMDFNEVFTRKEVILGGIRDNLEDLNPTIGMIDRIGLSYYADWHGTMRMMEYSLVQLMHMFPGTQFNLSETRPEHGSGGNSQGLVETYGVIIPWGGGPAQAFPSWMGDPNEVRNPLNHWDPTDRHNFTFAPGTLPDVQGGGPAPQWVPGTVPWSTDGDPTMPESVNRTRAVEPLAQGRHVIDQLMLINDIPNNVGMGMWPWGGSGQSQTFSGGAGNRPWIAALAYVQSFATGIIESNVYITTEPGVAPALPTTVSELVRGGTCGSAGNWEGTLTNVSVVWDAIDPADFEETGTFVVNGTANAAGNMTRVQAFITVGIEAATFTTGPETMTLTVGYAATQSGVFGITGFPVPTVSIESTTTSITWNAAENRLDIAAGLAAGTYTVSLTATNVFGSHTATFVLTILAPDVELTVDEDGNITINVGDDDTIELDGEGNIVITLPNADPEGDVLVKLPPDWTYERGVDEDGYVIVTITPPAGYEVAEDEDGYLMLRPVCDRELHEAYMFGSPTGEFMPRENINRAEVAAILVRTKLPAFEAGELPGDMDSFDVFPDVTEANWFYYYVAWAYYEGLVQGDDRGRFLPRAPIARQELAAMLSRTLEEYEEETGEMPFNDVADISNWAV